MQDISQKSPEEIAALIKDTEDKDTLRSIADQLDVSYSGNTGVDRLRQNIMHVLDLEPETEFDENDPVMKAMLDQSKKETKQETKPKSVLELSKSVQAQLNPNDKKYSEVERRAIVRAKALRLHRVKITNLDPNDSALMGQIITVYNKYTGKVSKYIPFGDENEMGYHVPEILLNELRGRTFVQRKEVRHRGQANAFGVKQYKTVQMKKFNIEVLDPLTPQELQSLGQDQKARGAIDPE